MEAFTNVASLFAKDFILLKICERFLAVTISEFIAIYINQFLHSLLLVLFTICLFNVNLKYENVKEMNEMVKNHYLCKIISDF